MHSDLVERAMAGDHDAFSELARVSIGRLYAAARLILRDPQRAEDATQEALVAAWRDLSSLRDPEKFEAWLHRLLVRACYREARRGRRRWAMEMDLRPSEGHEPDPAAHLPDRVGGRVPVVAGVADAGRHPGRARPAGAQRDRPRAVTGRHERAAGHRRPGDRDPRRSGERVADVPLPRAATSTGSERREPTEAQSASQRWGLDARRARPHSSQNASHSARGAPSQRSSSGRVWRMGTPSSTVRNSARSR